MVNGGMDRDRVEAIAVKMMDAIKENYLRGPSSRDRVLEALNAVAMCAGFILGGVPGDETRDVLEGFVKQAITDNVASVRETRFND